MNNYLKTDNILSGNSSAASEIKHDGEVSELSKKKYENRAVIDEIGGSEDHSAYRESPNFLTSSYGGNDENYEEAAGINTSFRKSASQHLCLAGEDDFDKILGSARQKIPKELSEMRELKNTALDMSPTFIFMQATEENESNRASDGVVHAINTGEGEEFKEVSVQTVEEKLFSCQYSCPICRLQDEDLKKKLTIFCLECPPYKKRRVVLENNSAIENDLQLSDDSVDGTRKGKEKCRPNEKILNSDERQIAPKYMSFIQNVGGGNRDCREFPCRTIRLGLSRSVKLPSLHKMSASTKSNLVDSG